MNRQNGLAVFLLGLVGASCDLSADCSSICYKISSYHSDECPELAAGCEDACTEVIPADDQATLDACYDCVLGDVVCGVAGCGGECEYFSEGF